jgi:uncharacterized protein
MFLAMGSVGLLLSLAYLGERERALRWLVYLTFATLDALAVLTGLAYVLLPLSVQQGTAVTGVTTGAVAELVVQMLPQLGLVSAAVGICGLVLLAPLARSLVARVLPIDPARVVHVAALQLAVHMIGLSAAVALLVPALASQTGALDELARDVARGGLAQLWVQAAAFVTIGVLGVGLFVRRSPRDVLARLGIEARVDWRWWLAVPVIGLASAVLVDALWARVDPPGLADVQRISGALFAPFLAYGLAGALTIGLSAGIGEECLFRGAAQPRLGLVFTSLLFAVLHTQYTISPALLQVFVLALLLGLTRQRANTTTAIAAHATYNFTLAALAIYAPSLAP